MAGKTLSYPVGSQRAQARTTPLCPSSSATLARRCPKHIFPLLPIFSQCPLSLCLCQCAWIHLGCLYKSVSGEQWCWGSSTSVPREDGWAGSACITGSVQAGDALRSKPPGCSHTLCFCSPCGVASECTGWVSCGRESTGRCSPGAPHPLPNSVHWARLQSEVTEVSEVTSPPKMCATWMSYPEPRVLCPIHLLLLGCMTCSCSCSPCDCCWDKWPNLSSPGSGHSPAFWDVMVH